MQRYPDSGHRKHFVFSRANDLTRNVLRALGNLCRVRLIELLRSSGAREEREQ
jgi:hypothetical protein